MALLEALGVWPGLVGELVEYLVAERNPARAVEAVYVEQTVERGHGGPIQVVDVDPGPAERRVARQVVLVAVGVDHRIDLDRGPTSGHHGDRRVDDTVSADPSTSTELPEG